MKQCLEFLLHNPDSSKYLIDDKRSVLNKFLIKMKQKVTTRFH
jgi:hypothetical protein